MIRIALALLIAALAATGCQYPRDPDGTLNRVEGGVLGLEWKLHDIVVVPVEEIDIPSPGVPEDARWEAAGSRHDSSLSGSQ